MTENLYELGIALGDDLLQLFSLPFREGKGVGSCCHKSHRHPVVVADFVESDGFYAVGFLVAETVGTGGLESYSEAFAGKSNGGIEIGAVGEVERQAYPHPLPERRGAFLMYDSPIFYKLCLDAKVGGIEVSDDAVALEGIGLETFEE